MRRLCIIPERLSADGEEAYLVGTVNSSSMYVVRRRWGHDARPPGSEGDAYYTAVLDAGEGRVTTFNTIRFQSIAKAEARAVGVLKYMVTEGNKVSFED